MTDKRPKAIWFDDLRVPLSLHITDAEKDRTWLYYLTEIVSGPFVYGKKPEDRFVYASPSKVAPHIFYREEMEKMNNELPLKQQPAYQEPQKESPVVIEGEPCTIDERIRRMREGGIFNG